MPKPKSYRKPFRKVRQVLSLPLQIFRKIREKRRIRHKRRQTKAILTGKAKAIAPSPNPGPTPNPKTVRSLKHFNPFSIFSRSSASRNYKGPACELPLSRPFELYGKSTPVILVDEDESSALHAIEPSEEADNVMGKGKGKLVAISPQPEDESTEFFPGGWDAECKDRLVKRSKRVEFVLEGPEDEGFETEDWLFYINTSQSIESMQKLPPKDQSG